MTDVSLLLPSRGRTGFIERQLDFYASDPAELNVVLLPATSQHFLELSELVKTGRFAPLRITILDPKKVHANGHAREDCEYTDIRDRITYAAHHTVSDRVVLASDDDFLLPAFLRSACNYLEDDEACVGVRGLTGLLRVGDRVGRSLDEPQGARVTLWRRRYEYPTSHAHQAFRAEWFLGNVDRHDLWNQWHAVYRREAFASAVSSLTTSEPIDFVTWEVGLHLHLIAQGTIAVMPQLGYIRQEGSSLHTASLNMRGPLRSRIGAITDKAFLVRILVDLFDIPEDQGHEIVNSWLTSQAIQSEVSPWRERARIVRDCCLMLTENLPKDVRLLLYQATHRSPRSLTEVCVPHAAPRITDRCRG